MSLATDLLLSSSARSGEPSHPRLEDYFRSVAGRIRSRLVSRCADDFDVRMASITTRKASTFPADSDISDNMVLATVRFDTLPVMSALVMERPLLSRIISAMLGDEEPEEDPEIDARPLSAVEVRIASRVFNDILFELNNAWPVSHPPGMHLSGQPGSARNAGVTQDLDELCVARLEVGLDDELFGVFLVAFPQELVRAISRPSGDASAGKRGSREVDLSKVMDLEVDVVAELGRVPMRVGDIRRLSEGDVISVGNGGAVRVSANGRTVLTGEAGIAGGQRCVRIVSRRFNKNA